jgi:hypothetical protein
VIPGVKDISQVFARGFGSVLQNVHHQYFVFGDNAAFQHIRKNVPLEQTSWRNKTVIPGANHTLIVDEQGNLLAG